MGVCNTPLRYMRTETLFDRLGRATNPTIFGMAFVLLRVAFGVLFLFSGVSKLGDWSASSYLLTATGPFASWFQSLAGSPVVDALNAWGMILIGCALLLGLLVRPAAVGGIVLMVLYYLAHFVENTAYGYIDQHVIYALVFFLFVAGGAGHAFGLNALAMRSLRRPNAFARFMLG